ncbi:MAG: DMT family transporter [Parcubacteria group bacterium]|nr:DMT family transporter [Parcubacteria group bacterium]
MKKLLSQHRKGLVLILISALMFGSYGVWSKLIGDSFGDFYQGWTRGLILTVVLLPILLYKKEVVPIKREDRKWLVVFLLFTSMTQAPIFYAFNHMDIGSATLLFFVTMLLTMYAVGFLFLNERVTRVKTISFVLASLGLYFVFSFSWATFALLATLMAILNGVASGGEVSFSKKLSGNYTPLYLSWLSWLTILVVNGIISVAIEEVQVLPSFDVVWLYQIGYSVASLFGFWFIIAGLKYVEASIGGLLGLLEIVFSIIFGILIFGEGLSSRVVLGGLLIIAAASLPHIKELIYRNKATQIVS